MAITWKNVGIPTLGGSGSATNNARIDSSALARQQNSRIAGMDRMFSAFNKYAKREKADVSDQLTGLFDNIKSEDQFNQMKASGALDYDTIRERLNSNSVNRGELNTLRKGKVDTLRGRLAKERANTLVEENYADRDINQDIKSQLLGAGVNSERIQEIRKNILNNETLNNRNPALTAANSALSGAVASNRATRDDLQQQADYISKLDQANFERAKNAMQGNIDNYNVSNPSRPPVNPASAEERDREIAFYKYLDETLVSEEGVAKRMQAGNKYYNKAAATSNAENNYRNKLRKERGKSEIRFDPAQEYVYIPVSIREKVLTAMAATEGIGLEYFMGRFKDANMSVYNKLVDVEMRKYIQQTDNNVGLKILQRAKDNLKAIDFKGRR